jgi:methionine aminopeptidase
MQPELKVGDIVKFDLGCHIDGYISVAAHTLVVSETAESPLLLIRNLETLQLLLTMQCWLPQMLSVLVPKTPMLPRPLREWLKIMESTQLPLSVCTK